MQYFVFTVVALIAFFYAFIHQPTNLPVLPDTLVGLTSASAAAYVAKKAATSNSVTITAVTPQKASTDEEITIYGTNLLSATGLSTVSIWEDCIVENDYE